MEYWNKKLETKFYNLPYLDTIPCDFQDMYLKIDPHT
jgi:hypothetical protein